MPNPAAADRVVVGLGAEAPVVVDQQAEAPAVLALVQRAQPAGQQPVLQAQPERLMLVQRALAPLP